MRTASVVATERKETAKTDSDKQLTPNEILSEKRKDFRLTIANVAQSLRYPGQSARNVMLKGMEDGEVASQLQFAILLARFYDTTVEDLFGHLVQNPPDEITEEMEQAAAAAAPTTRRRGRPKKNETPDTVTI